MIFQILSLLSLVVGAFLMFDEQRHKIAYAALALSVLFYLLDL